MEMNRKILLGAVAAVVVIGGAWYAIHATTTPSKAALSSFAQCMKDKGTKFYGAFWCPHCQAQEQELQQSRDDLKSIGLYIECSKQDGQTQTDICIKEKITGYPTWVFPDHSTTTAVLSLETLAQKTGCALPTSQ